ncbi:MAG: 2-C-methyl-D-erythritol 2,4-cyclodiphosphate synthase [Clostridia bacterium]|nr:2-C-methyl-D-erythritol 2,4-cyclodiphosphate synthase [Clostridia bacterium]MDE7328186.1 2-C-methyl-D-erythritol 2,4-cyclodiphosphate synthase [Clostridia bacterium]
MKFDVILACGGSGSRCNLGYNKLALDIGGITVLEKTLSIFIHPDISKIIISYNEKDYDWIKSLDLPENAILCAGGATRAQSVANALELAKDSDFVIIHDGARPFLPRKSLLEGMSDAIKYGSSVLYVPSTDSLRIVDGETSKPIDRALVVRIQTPQIFKTQEIKKAYDLAGKNSAFTDDASLYEEYIRKSAHLTLGDDRNVKITTEQDCDNAIGGDAHIGNGWDTHRLDFGRDLILGGIKIPHDKGLVAHSDGDVLIHAIMDALLSSMHERDIGVLFPDTDDKYKDISSVKLLEEVLKLVKAKGLAVKSISAVIMAQKPKLSQYIPSIQQNLADIIGIDENRVSLSATTTERLGMVGREEGISVSSVAVLNKRLQTV